MAAPPRSNRHLPHFHRDAPVKAPVRFAATANVAIATLNNGDAMDGGTVATGNRVLLPVQSDPVENGIYEIGATNGTTVRAYDMESGELISGTLVAVRAGTVNAGKLFLVSNAANPTIDTDAITFTEFAPAADDSVVPFDHGNMGATETIDVADGTWHRGTLNADCTITVTGFTADEAVVLVFEALQDGTGGHAITWDADVDFGGSNDQPTQTADTVTVFLLFSSEGDSVIYGGKVGGSAVASLDDLTDVTITAPAEDDDLRYNGTVWVNDPRKWEVVTDGEDVFVWESDDLVYEWSS